MIAPQPETRPMINGEFEGKNLLSIEQFTRADVEVVLDMAAQMEEARILGEIPQLLGGRVVKAVMFENSSRTADTFLSAAAYLGATPLQPNLATSSKSKGENDIETVRVFATNADGVLVRHSQPGFMDELAGRIRTPFTSGGNPGDHVLQTLKDLYTWQKLYGGIDGSRIVLAGYAAKYRAAISLVKGLGLFEGIDLTIATPALGTMPKDIIEQARQRGIHVTETGDLRPLLNKPGIFYIMRPPLEYCETKGERATILDAYDHLGYNISHHTMSDADPNADIFHPLPYNGEITDDFYTDPRAQYEAQESNGLAVNLAVLALQLAQSKLEETSGIDTAYREPTRRQPAAV